MRFDLVQVNMKVLIYRSILFCLPLVSIEASKRSMCEYSNENGAKCLCDKQQILCDKLDELSWASFLLALPQNTQGIMIKNSKLTLTISDDVAILHLSKTTYLDIHNSTIVTVGPNAFYALPNLIKLQLRYDAIQNIDAEAFVSLASLNMLDLSGNMLTDFEKGTLSTNKRLRILDLSHNYIEFLEQNMFNDATSLDFINITSNHLYHIHPATFDDLNELRIIDISNNKLEVIFDYTFSNLTSLEMVYVQNNPWVCDCGFKWLLKNSGTNSVLKKMESQIQCSAPDVYENITLSNVPIDNLLCKKPQIFTEAANIVRKKLGSLVLECSYSGFPKPSIHWVTPRGILVSKQQQKWIKPQILHKNETRNFVQMPNHPSSSVIALDNGSLLIRELRYYFTGSYSCVAQNSGGSSVVQFNVTVESVIVSNIHFSMAVGGATALVFMIISLIYACIRAIVFHHLKKNHLKRLAFEAEKEEEIDDLSPVSLTDSNWCTPYWEREYTSPWDSPIKCTTPVEADMGLYYHPVSNIRDTLEGVRQRLRIGMERSVIRIRNRAHHVSESSRQYIHNIKESSNQTIQRLRSSSSNYSNKVKAGVVLGVEQVKYHVQSMKELCMTGNMDQTTSATSVFSGTDLEEKKDVVSQVSNV